MERQNSSNCQPFKSEFDKMVIEEALKKSLDDLDNLSNPRWIPQNPVDDQSSAASLLIHEIFGGEILKTHKKRGWHFYNRIGGERIDFVKSESDKSSEDVAFEDIPATPDETYNYFQKEDYASFFTRFIRALEETVGLDKFRPGFTT